MGKWIVLAFGLLGCAAGSEGYQDPSPGVAAARTELINECDIGAAQCDPHAACIDTAAGYDCKCGPGFYGDGRTCADLDECAQGTAECPEGTRCENAPGGYSCAPDEEQAQTATPACPNGCGEGARCLEADDGARCVCLDGYELDGGACVASISVSLEGGAEYVRTDGPAVFVLPPGNLLTNPSTEGGDLAGWTVRGCAEGWAIVSPGIFGEHAIAAGQCRVAREQTIDLLAAGVDVASLDGEAQPEINALAFHRGGGPDAGDWHALTLELLDANGAVLHVLEDINQRAPVGATTQRTEVRALAYPPGVRFARVRQEAYSAEIGDGHHGPILDGIALTVGDRGMVRRSLDGANWSDWFPFYSVISSGIAFAYGEGEARVFIEAKVADGRVYHGSDAIRLE